MDALVAQQYGFFFAVLAGALVAGIVVAVLLSRKRRPEEEVPPPEGGAGHGLLPYFMVLLVALAVGTGIVLLIPVGMILLYFPHWRVDVMAMAAAFLLVLPLMYAWRARPS